jgi:hypothetical protein
MVPAKKVPVSPQEPASLPERKSSASVFTLRKPTSEHFFNVPTHAVTVLGNRRACARAFLRLPLQLTMVNGHELEFPIPLETRDISASGVYFLSPQRIEPGTAIQMEVGLTGRPQGMGSVRMTTAAKVVRLETPLANGWHGLAASFDFYEFRRDEPLPPRFR